MSERPKSDSKSISKDSANGLANELEALKASIQRQKAAGIRTLKRSKPVAKVISNPGIAGRIRKDEEHRYNHAGSSSADKSRLNKNYHGKSECRNSKECSGYNESLLVEKYDYSQVYEDDNIGSDNGPDTKAGNTSKEEVVEITDEFGRTRMVKRDHYFATASVSLSPDNEKPSNLIYGDIIQHQAFKLNKSDAEHIRAMGDAPVLDAHFDATWERRELGVGHFQFSQDNVIRSQQMDGLKRTKNEAIRRSP